MILDTIAASTLERVLQQKKHCPLQNRSPEQEIWTATRDFPLNRHWRSRG